MKTIPEFLEEFDEKSKEEHTWYNQNGNITTLIGMTMPEAKIFLEQSLNQLLDEMPIEPYPKRDSESFGEKVFINGYDMKTAELQEHIKKLRG